MTELLLLLVGAVLVNNFVLVKFLGLCPFMGVSRQLDAALGMALATGFVLTMAAGLSWAIQRWLLEPLGIGELRNLLLVARLVTHAASLRRESRGAHFRADFPEASEALRRRSFLTLADLGRSDALQPDCRQPLKEARHAVPAGL